MQGKYARYLTEAVTRRLHNYPVVSILGPRQCGKTTLAFQIMKECTASSSLECSVS
ncbi:AAA family ATPase [bacterium]|nr:AAA family ATPase [bacterium]